ncbi:MAG: hypothetical protein Kilf2KO_27500 [Rhodospirillales bacterium]
MKSAQALRKGLITLTVAALPLGLTVNSLQAAETVMLPKRTLSAVSPVAGPNLQLVQAEKHETRAHKESKRDGKMRGGPLGSLTRMELGNQAAESLAALTGKPTAEVRSSLKDDGLRETLARYGVDRAAFATAMQPRLEAMVREAQADGRITERQADSLMTRIAEGPAADAEEGKKRRGNETVRAFSQMQAANLMATTLSEMTGKPLAEVQATLQAEGPRHSLKALDIERDSFREAMKPRVLAAVEEAQRDGRITAEQAALLIERIEEGPKKKRHG